MGEQRDTDWTDSPICPHCGHVETDWSDGITPYGDCWDATCNSCGADYRVELTTIQRFTTTKPESEVTHS